MVRNLPVGISSEDHRGHNPGKTVEFISLKFYQKLGISSAYMVLDGFYFLLVFLLVISNISELLKFHVFNSYLSANYKMNQAPL
jgi:hypothetical protein